MTREVAGELMASRCVVVRRGPSHPVVVPCISKDAEASAAAVPTMKRVCALTSPELRETLVSPTCIPEVSSARRLLFWKNSKPVESMRTRVLLSVVLARITSEVPPVNRHVPVCAPSSCCDEAKV